MPPSLPAHPTDPPDRPDHAVTPRRLLAWLDLLRGAVVARDEVFVWELLGYREARLAPRALLEEALAMARAPLASVRAPVELLRFAWVVERLATAGEPMPGHEGAAADDASAPPAADPPAPQLEFAWPRRADRPRDRRRPA